jgi:oligopeptide/dipeptide ABC transporter ATP-binding protein
LADEVEPILALRGLSKAYPQRRPGGRGRAPLWALRDVDLDVWPGERLGIVGESGSGKSTLTRMLLCLEPPTSGRVYHEGRVLTGAAQGDLAGLRRDVQIVFQDPMGSLDPRLKVGTSIAEPLRALKVPGDHNARVDELLEAVGLPRSAGRRFPHQFSGGQRQRIAIARALAPHPRVLVADEAVSALDVSVRAQVLNLIRRLVDRFGLTLVFVSHDMAVVRHLCTRVVVLYLGRVVEDGPTAEIFRTPAHPYTKALLGAVPRIGGTIPTVADAVTGVGAAPPGPVAEQGDGGCPYLPRCPVAVDRCAIEMPQLRGVAAVGGRGAHSAACHLAGLEPGGRAAASRQVSPDGSPPDTI